MQAKLNKPAEGPEGQLVPSFDILEHLRSESTGKIRSEETSQDHFENFHCRILHPIIKDTQRAPEIILHHQKVLCSIHYSV